MCSAVPVTAVGSVEWNTATGGEIKDLRRWWVTGFGVAWFCHCALKMGEAIGIQGSF